MIEPIWDDLLSEEERELLRLTVPQDRPAVLGKHPILIIIDCQPNYVGADEPIVEQLDRFPSGGGDKAWASVRRIVALRDKARQAGVPVLYTRNVQRQTLKFDSFSQKTTRDQSKYLDTSPTAALVPELAPAPNEILLAKAYPSAFYGTPLKSYLTRLGVDTLIITGNSTSGCCRQTAVDALSMDYHVGYVEDCITDRTNPSHKIGMMDMWVKYGCLITSDEAARYFEGLKGGGAS